jgi:hypothetical protein
MEKKRNFNNCGIDANAEYMENLVKRLKSEEKTPFTTSANEVMNMKMSEFFKFSIFRN